MSTARIYRPAKTAMQSGRAHARRWVLDFEPAAPKISDPLMGWTGTTDMDGQVRLRFDSKEDAVAFAERNGLAYRLVEPKERAIHPKNYADNFAFNRVR